MQPYTLKKKKKKKKEKKKGKWEKKKTKKEERNLDLLIDSRNTSSTHPAALPF